MMDTIKQVYDYELNTKEVPWGDVYNSIMAYDESVKSALQHHFPTAPLTLDGRPMDNRIINLTLVVYFGNEMLLTNVQASGAYVVKGILKADAYFNWPVKYSYVVNRGYKPGTWTNSAYYNGNAANSVVHHLYTAINYLANNRAFDYVETAEHMSGRRLVPISTVIALSEAISESWIDIAEIRKAETDEFNKLRAERLEAEIIEDIFPAPEEHIT